MQKHLVQGRFKGVELDLCIFTTYTFCKNKNIWLGFRTIDMDLSRFKKIMVIQLSNLKIITRILLYSSWST